MQSESLRSSYDQYKKDTNFVATWLLSTALRLGYQESNSATPILTPKTPRLKGKARKLAREAASKENRNGNAKTYAIELQEFVPLARHIAGTTEPLIEVPDGFTRALEDNIKARKYHQDWHRSQSNTHDEEQATHKYFIQILEQVQKLLPRSSPTVPKAKIVRNTSLSPDSSGLNRFSNLSFEESNEIEHPGTTETQTTTFEDEAQPDIADIKVKVKDNLDGGNIDALIAAACFFADMHDLRRTVCGLWKLYHRGILDLGAASIATNTATDFIREQQNDLESSYPGQLRLNDYTCIICDHIDKAELDKGMGSELPEACLEHPRFILSDLVNIHLCDAKPYAPMVSPGSEPLYPHEPKRLLMNLKLAFGVFPEYLVLFHNPKPIQAEHEILRGLRELKRDKKPLVWLSFGLQLFLDMRHVLRDNVEKGFQDLLYESNLVFDSIEETLALHQTAKHSKTSELNDAALRGLLEIITRWTRHDIVDEFRRSLQPDESLSDKLEPFHLLRRDPLWCGLLLYNIRIVAHEGSLVTANSWCMVRAAAHLYNGLKQDQDVLSDWQDLETLLAAQGMDKVFVGGTKPVNLQSCLENYGYAVGLTPGIFKSDPRRLRPRIQTARGKTLKELGNVSWVFKHRYCDNSQRISYKPEDIDKLLSSTQASKKYSLKGKKITLTTRIAQLVLVLNDEAESFFFDYFHMHRICWKIIQNVIDAVGSYLPESSQVLDDERHFAAIIFDLLSEVQPGSRASIIQQDILRRATQSMNKILAEEGALVTAKQKAYLANRRKR